MAAPRCWGRQGKWGVLGGEGSGSKSRHQTRGCWEEVGDPERKERDTRVQERLQVSAGRTTMVTGTRERRPGLGDNVGKRKSESQGQRGPELRGVRHLVSEGRGGSTSEQKWSLDLVKEGLKVKRQTLGALRSKGE